MFWSKWCTGMTNFSSIVRLQHHSEFPKIRLLISLVQPTNHTSTYIPFPEYSNLRHSYTTIYQRNAKTQKKWPYEMISGKKQRQMFTGEPIKTTCWQRSMLVPTTTVKITPVSCLPLQFYSSPYYTTHTTKGSITKSQLNWSIGSRRLDDPYWFKYTIKEL